LTFKVFKLIVGKGKTITDEKQNEWTKQYYELDATIEDEGQLELAKNSLESLIDMWLKGENVSPEKPKPKWDPAKIKWTEAQGSSGPYERSDDVNSFDFKELMKDLENHNRKLSHQGYFYWKFEKSAIIGRKKRVK
jgi:hypothetical protein